MALVENNIALVASIIFGISSLLFAYRFSRSDGYSDFSVGISYLDFYAIILTLVPLTAALSYLMMSLGLGSVNVYGLDLNWLRYFEWGISTPILLVGLTMLGLDKKITIQAMILQFLVIVTGFLAAFFPMPMKAVFFILSSAAFLGIIYLLMRPVAEKVSERPEIIQHLYKRLRNFTIGIWLIYPFIWIPSTEGLTVIGAETSLIAFTVLDLVAKIGYAYIVLRSVEQVNKV